VLISLSCGAGPRQGDHRRGIICWSRSCTPWPWSLASLGAGSA